MMKKLLSLALAAALSLSLSACAGRNDGMYERTRVRNNTGIDVERLAQPNNNNVNYNYRDGVYTGYGNSNAGGNEMATVTIRNGRITDIKLMSVNGQGGTNNTTGAGTNYQERSGYGLTPGTITNRPVGGGTHDTIENGGGGIIGGTAGNVIDGARTRLVTSMLQEQRYDVDIENNDVNVTGRVNNWKIAVSRALDQAR